MLGAVRPLVRADAGAPALAGPGRGRIRERPAASRRDGRRPVDPVRRWARLRRPGDGRPPDGAPRRRVPRADLRGPDRAAQTASSTTGRARARRRRASSIPRTRSGTVVENQADRNQRWTIGGIAAGFLCRLYLAEPRPEYLDLARRYQAFSMAATGASSSTPRCLQERLGLFAAVLRSRATPAYRGLDPCRRATGSWRCRTADGWWHPVGRAQRRPSRVWITLEYVMHLDTLIAALASRPWHPVAARGRAARLGQQPPSRVHAGAVAPRAGPRRS